MVSELMRLARWKKIGVASAVSLKTQLSRWENGHVTPDYYQGRCCAKFSRPRRANSALVSKTCHPASARQSSSGAALIAKREWDRDDISHLSSSFDDAISSSALADVEMLAHEWLAADKPQLVELNAGRRVGDSLVATAEHRVIQLRRADDFVSGRTSHTLVQQELKATTTLLDEATLTEDQIRRLLTVTGELAQLAAWVAADAGLYKQAARYTEGGVLAAHAADNAAPSGKCDIDAGLSAGQYRKSPPSRLCSHGQRTPAHGTALRPRQRHCSWNVSRGPTRNPVTSSSCERALGQVEDNFDHSKPEDDPDWVYWLNREEIDVMAGRCYTELKQPRRAEPLLRAATSQYDSVSIRENALYLSWLAEDYILLDEIDLAAEIAKHVLELGSRVDSARTDERLRHLVGLLRRSQDVSSVASFLDQYKSLNSRSSGQ